ncbi:MAG: hypothetical protein JWM16_2968 [Verrucomicrobiales bacterium]|nr:hypothetical protein [Verrucomicrobiales bacterium]
MDKKPEYLQAFLNLSAELCGFSVFTLSGTGYAIGYCLTVQRIVGPETMQRLLEEFKKLPSGNAKAREKALRVQLLSNEEFGPVARNIMKLWFVSTWYELPGAWHDKFGRYGNDQTFIPFPYAYPEGLLWPGIGSHPPGAKPTGYASWEGRPVFLEFKGDPMLWDDEP